MKHTIAVLLGGLLCLAALPNTAEARDQDRRHRDVRRHREYHREHYADRHHRSHRVWRGAHYTWSRGHRVFIPGRYVIVF